MSSIFIQIPSYHDFELRKTILNIIENSSGENIINFGVHITYNKKDEIDVSDIPNVKFSKSKAPKNLGVGMGRYLANKFYDKEDFYFQIDSHTRLEKNWDKTLIDCYNKYLSIGYNPVLSAYPAGYRYVDYKVVKDIDPVVSVAGFEKDKSFLKNYIPHQIAVKNQEKNIFTKSISAAFVFSKGEIAKIEPNKNIFFWGEESIMAARLYTHGYDLMLPDQQVMYHLYFDWDNQIGSQRRVVSNDFPEESIKLQKISDKEMYRIINFRTIGDQSLGSVRSLAEYEEYAGLDFIGKKIVGTEYIV